MRRHCRQSRFPALAGAVVFVFWALVAAGAVKPGAPLKPSAAARQGAALQPTAAPQLDLSPEAVMHTDISVARPGPVERIIARFVTELMSRNHYSQHPIDEDISREWFNEYFDELDPNRVFFLASDIADFHSYESTLGEIVEDTGNIDFAYDVYERYLTRVRQWAAYSLSLLRKPMDFNTDESILIDRRDVPWCQNMGELHDLWRRRLMNSLLVEQLSSPAAKSNVEQKDKGTARAMKTPAERIAESYVRYLKRKTEVEPIEVLEGFLCSLTRVYDPHSDYMAPDTEADFNISMKLSLQGIGAVLTTKGSYVQVVSIIPGGPAARDGRLKPGDRIIAVAQENEDPVDVVDMRLRKVVDMIRGPKGTRVRLTVLEAGSNSPTIIDIKRDKVKLTDQEAQSQIRTIEVPSVKPGAPGAAPRKARVAVIWLPSFYADFAAKARGDKDYRSATRDVARLIKKAEAKPLDGLILDLRSNGGGSLDEAVSMAGLFIKSGPIVQVRTADGRIDVRYDTDDRVAYGGPMIVLTNRLSASASEIVTAALQDYGRAVIVGEHCTHGKGTVQTVYHLDRQLGRLPLFRNRKAGSLKFTMAKFYRVNGGSTQVKGVTPDISFPSFTDSMELGEAELPHVLPWDRIKPLKVSCAVNVRPMIPELRKLSAARLAKDPSYQQHLKDVKAFAKRQQIKTLSLNRQKRIAYQAVEEKWAKKLRGLQLRPSFGKNKDKNAPKDWMLNEALNIMGDMISLEKTSPPGTGETRQIAGPKKNEPAEQAAP